jgi:hypothetical protein
MLPAWVAKEGAMGKERWGWVVVAVSVLLIVWSARRTWANYRASHPRPPAARWLGETLRFPFRPPPGAGTSRSFIHFKF